MLVVGGSVIRDKHGAISKTHKKFKPLTAPIWTNFVNIIELNGIVDVYNPTILSRLQMN